MLRSHCDRLEIYICNTKAPGDQQRVRRALDSRSGKLCSEQVASAADRRVKIAN